MNKLIVLSFVSIMCLTGCGATETLNCTYKRNANNGSAEISYDIDHEQDEIKKVRITYNYNFNTINDNNTENNSDTDGVGTGTDGTTNDTQADHDGIVDGVVGSAIDTIVGGVTEIILDSAGLRDRHANVQNTYGNIAGFSVQNTNDRNQNYTVTYVIDYDTISDNDLARFNLSRSFNEIRESYVNQGFTCK